MVFLSLIILYISIIFIFPSNRRGLFYFGIVLTFYLFAFNRQNPDYDAYVDYFIRDNLSVELGYGFLVSSLKAVNGSHTSLLLILSLLITYFFISYSKLVYAPPILIPLYLLFPGPVDIIQIRNTFSVFLFYCGILFYLRNKNFLSIIFLTLCTLFHFFGIVYVVIFIGSLYYRKITGPIIIFICSITFFLVANYLLNILIESGLSRSLFLYVSEEFKFISLIFWGGQLFLDIIILKIFINKKISKERNNFDSKLYNIIVTSLIFITGVGILYDFNRLYRAVYGIKLMLGVSLYYNLKAYDKYILATYLTLTSIALYLYFDYYLDNDLTYFGF